MARPSEYTPEMAKKICRAIATNPRGIKHICETNPDLPTPQTISNWKIDYPEFFAQYLVAKESQGTEIEEMVWEMALDVDERPEAAAKYANIFRTAQWKLSQLSPKIFGPKSENKTELTSAVVQQLTDVVIEQIAKHERQY